MNLSKKQAEFWKYANHRWNIKSGATRSGKTFLDYYNIPRRIRSLKGKDGLIVILGNTKGTLRRNVIEPMQNIWGQALVSDIKQDNTARLFGETVYCLGADKIGQVDVIRGSSIKYCYGDEIVTWHPDILEILKSRLDKFYSIFDGTCNPDSPDHPVKKFIDSDADIFYQQYTIFDNPFLDDIVKKEMIKEHKGVWYARNIMGEWVRAEGLIYTEFCQSENDFYIEFNDVPKNDIGYICIGQDFGGNKSKHTFCATGVSHDYRRIYVLKSSEYEAKDTSVQFVLDKLNDFTRAIIDTYGYVDYVFADSAEQTIINTERKNTNLTIQNSIKNPIIDRIRATDLMLSGRRLKIVRGQNDSLANALRSAVWNDKANKAERLDIPGQTNICPLDAFEYSWELWIKQLSSFTR